jgi:hypothetical protein
MAACGLCGQAIEGSARKRYCDATCRKAAQKARSAAVSTAKRVAAKDAAGVGLLGVVREAMAGREREPLAQMALNLAAQLEAGEATASESAQLNRELRQTLAELRLAPAAADPLDELAERRRKRHGG